ncbi:unnamed protein product [Durusdinium trenchii]|uniref:Nudix hydrolase domain-containing protein n=1 Tax=Durusdinium trenchii TaxID=1381693 RepID=A0ABP0NYC2_9DINO
MIPNGPLRVRPAATVVCIRGAGAAAKAADAAGGTLSLEEATRNEGPGSQLGSDASARIRVLFGEKAKRRALFHSNWEVLMGQGEVQNWIRSRPEKEVPMRYPGEWKFAGGVVDHGETPRQAAMRELEEEFQVKVALTEATCKLRLLSVKQTRPIRNVSNIMFNYVAAAEENPWLQELNVQEVNASLAQRRKSFAEAVEGGNFYTLGKEEQENLAPEIHQEYREAFQYRWTENVLLSSVLTLTPGPNTLTIDGQEVVIDLPAEDRGIRGVFWADPCFSSRYVNCAFGQTFQTLERSTRMLNAAFEDDSLDLFGVLGDNFYDQSGELTQEFFSRVSLNVKRRFWLMVNGNHDNWVCGFPFCGSSSDDFGIGQMQYYPMDTVASKNDRIFSFDIDPDRNKQWNQFLNNGTNFLFYHKLGNVGFLGYTGAADFAETLPHLHAACEYFAVSQPEVIFLLGHWNNEGLGCSQGMSVPEIHSTLMQIPGCSAFGRRVKYMDGHEHCNYVQAKDEQSAYGFMIGGHGMADAMCAPQYGFAYLDTTGDRIRLYYFEVGRSGVWGIVVGAVLGVLLGALLGFWGVGTAISAMCRSRCTTSRKKRTFAACGVAGAALGGVAGYLLGMYFLNPIFPPQDRFDQIFGCAQANGLHACTHLATLWLDESTQLTRLWM